MARLIREAHCREAAHVQGADRMSTDMAEKALVGRTVRVCIDGRHDFHRYAEVRAVDGDNLLVRWVGCNLPDEWIPMDWM